MSNEESQSNPAWNLGKKLVIKVSWISKYDRENVLTLFHFYRLN